MTKKQEKAPFGAESGRPDFDVIIAGDMTQAGDRPFRIAQEIRHYAAGNLRVGVLQSTRPGADARIAQEVQACVRRGLAEVVDAARGAATDLLVVHAPSEVSWTAKRLTGISSDRTVLVCHSERDFTVQRLTQRLAGSAEIVCAPTNIWLRQAAPAKLQLTADDWLPRLEAGETAQPVARPGERIAVGWIIMDGALPAPKRRPARLDLRTIAMNGGVAPAGATATISPGNGNLSLDRLTALDALVCFPAAGETALPDTLIWTALSRGALVVLPERLKRHYGTGPVYCDAGQALKQITRILGDDATRTKARNAARRAARKRLPHAPVEGTDAPLPRETSTPRPVMFVASNGVGVGHVTRLLAIARRLDPDVPVVFVTQAQAVGAIERFGYLTEYLPSATYVGGAFETWDQWFRFELERLIDAYDPSLVVYDGNNPSHGLIEAVATRRDCKLAWVRRGMWGNTTSPFLDNARWCDLVLEPGELDGQADDGVTAHRRHEVQTVEPVRLLDGEELLSRADAAEALGLDPAKPSVLIQLGAGYNRDIVSLIDQLVAVLQQFPQLQISVAEWVNGAHSLNYWPEVKYIRGYPLSQYFRAFDFSVAAAGYNTFHEIISFELPTIFIPNRHPTMDDQGGRADHAQDLHAAFELEEEDLQDLPELVTLLMDAKARAFLATKCGQLARPNGALAAARSLTEMVRTTS